MKRQQSIQGGSLPKRPCPTLFPAQTQGLQPSINQTNQYLYNSNQAYDNLPKQPAQQLAQKPCHYNNSNYNNSIYNNSNYNNSNYNNNYNNSNSNLTTNTNNGVHRQNNSANDWNKPMQYSPLQFALAGLTPASFTSTQFAPTQPTDFNTSLNVTLGVNYRDGNIPLPYPTHVPNRVSTMQNSWDASVPYNPPQQPNQSVVNGQLCEPRPNRPVNNMTAMSVGTNITQYQHNGRNNTNGASFHFSRRPVYGAGVAKPPQPPQIPQKRRKHTKSGEPQGNDTVVDLVTMTSRTPELSTAGPVTGAPVAPVNQPTEFPQAPDGDSVKPCEPVDDEAIVKAGILALKAHLEVLEQQEAEAKRAQEEKERVEAEKKRAEAFEWPGDESELPAECFANMRLPGCEYRAHAICVGSPQPGLPRNRYKVPEKGRLVVYAVRRGSDGVEFKLVVPHSNPEEVTQASEIHFNHIKLNVNFSDMDEPRVIRWVRYLLDAVPGNNDSVTMWSN
ncbi:hypothetical protein F4801DRAFT_584965 [Xylaria longipes]|nr:hypothetical protein F4801DRAFT_584965 [Xylaria longipes]